jgi:hypothetical protein
MHERDKFFAVSFVAEIEHQRQRSGEKIAAPPARVREK